MKRENILQLIANLQTAVKLTQELDGIMEEKVAVMQEKLVKVCISEFLKTCEGSSEKKLSDKSSEKYTAPKPPATIITLPLTVAAPDKPSVDARQDLTTKMTEDKAESAAKRTDHTAADAQFMADLAKQIAALPNKRSPIAALVTQPVFERAYSIAGSREELIKRLGISKATVQRLYVKYMPNDKGGNEDE